MKKIFLFIVFIFGFFIFSLNVFADTYVFYYGQGCPHCANVERFFKEDNTRSNYKVIEKEVYFSAKNRDEFLNDSDTIGIPEETRGVPTLIVKDDNGNLKLYKIGDSSIIDYFKSIKVKQDNNVVTHNNEEVKKETKKTFFEHVAFFSVLLPAAISDSINPCEFAVMLILLGSILIKYRKKRKVIMAGFLFSLAVFLSYFLMGLGIYSALGNFSSVFYFKLGVGILGIIVGLANLKDYFWYG
ncbi:MAG: hypothetical protein PHN31_06950, partial [Candidatus Gracilibacteria bacterium]|nr:hypothetical protein [Candidatus Gracilibacteria bacterium]